MENERAIEILDPEHREPYESLEPINEACRMGVECVFEGIVHESRVDGVVLAWLCLLLVREIEQFERKIRGDGR